ncbi:right-handed parallel beta-helix repeat-containing protein [Ahniella affigens]|nr:right-handed parallel beta-helix repeat-containing protein [Ahniella affigens]
MHVSKFRCFGQAGALLWLFLVASTASSHAAAAEWFVARNGSDSSGTGSAAAPFRTITHVLDPANEIVSAGDTVTVRGPAGSNLYEECDVRLRVRLTLRSPPGERAHIHCALNNVDTVTVQVDPDASGSTLSRLELSGGFYYGLFFQTDWFTGGGEAFTGASNVLVDDLKIHDTGRDGIKITPQCNDITIRHSEIWNSGAIYPPGTPLDDKNAEGIDNVNGSRMRVHDTYIHDTATTGLYFKGGAADVVIERNIIERTGVGGIMFGFDTSPEFFDTAANPLYYEAVRGVVRNNVIRDTGYAGIGLYASLNATVVNNTIVSTAQLGHAALYFGVTLQDFEPQAGRPANTNPLIRNNLIIQDGGDCVAIRFANELGGLSGLDGHPGTDYNWFHDNDGACQFVDRRPGSSLSAGGSLSQWRAALNADANSDSGLITVTADGHLPADSPALDRGQVLSQVIDDMDGETRTSPYDIGSDERPPGILFAHGFE